MLEIRTPELPKDAKAKVIRMNFAEGYRVESGDCLFFSLMLCFCEH